MTTVTEHARELHELIAQVQDEDLRAALTLKALPLAQRADDVATLLEYRRHVAVDDVASPVDESDPYMRALGDALSLVLLAHGVADDEDDPRAGHVALDNVATVLAELGYQRREADPLIDRDNSRGLGQMIELPGSFAGHDSGRVRVYESSAASWPHLWLSVKEPQRNGQAPIAPTPSKEATIQLRAETAWLLARQIVALVRGHYHGVDVEELTEPMDGDEVVAYFAGGSVIGTVELISDTDDRLGIMGTPLDGADAVFVIRKADGE